MQKERRDGGGGGRGEHGDTSGEEEKEVWRKKPKMSRVIIAKSLNKHV